jgi:predicted GIY-YIG superfamily endonuclease
MDLESTVVVFFMRGGHRMIDQHIAPLDDAPAPDEDTRRVLEVAAAVDWRWRNHNVYVVELDLDVFKERRFFEANLDYIPGTKLCVYVGMTGLDPEERFRRHRAGIQASSYVRRYGVRLCPALYSDVNPMPHDLAKEMETWLCRFLRSQGYGVWQN